LAVVSSLDDITAQLKAPVEITLDCSEVEPGIDNYHADVEISAEFRFRVKDTIDQNLKRLVAGKSLISGNAEAMRSALDKYNDQLEETLGRQQYAGARSLLVTQEKIAWFRKQPISCATHCCLVGARGTRFCCLIIMRSGLATARNSRC